MKLTEDALKKIAVKLIQADKAQFQHRLSLRRKVFKITIPLKEKAPLIFFVCYHCDNKQILWLKKETVPFVFNEEVYHVTKLRLRKLVVLHAFEEPATIEQVREKLATLTKDQNWKLGTVFLWQKRAKAQSAIVLDRKKRKVLWVSLASLRHKSDVSQNDKRCLKGQYKKYFKKLYGYQKKKSSDRPDDRLRQTGQLSLGTGREKP